MAAALDEDGEDGDISRVHAGDAARLGERLRMKLLQLLTALVAHGKTLVIVEPLWNDNGFVLLGPFGGFLFLLDVGRIITSRSIRESVIRFFGVNGFFSHGDTEARRSWLLEDLSQS